MTNKPEESMISELAVEKHDFATTEKQDARAFLRERFLRVVTGIVGKRAEFHLFEDSHVTGEFRGCDVDCLEIYVRNLETPLGKVPEAILRTTDVIHFDFEEMILKKE
ncbi:gem-associated protein 7-like [Cephus cinctus]|uniref:Gem-associated protein 7-like n=1 Tax=Cephus cinctus TaxID=211228 RepID=A0AAJ7FNW7_CEPCN|nr:gem-associated protein 7-like [Cephus cinctus]XP_015601019.1 gem-associated protein 7-like [Cephus cinctus]XP_024943584.1 gem-associated protein 7-like [Cephus cinctus]